MSFEKWGADRIKKSKVSTYDTKDHNTKYYRKQNYDKYNTIKKKTTLDQIIELRASLRSPYENNPSYAHIEKVLTHALVEITNLEKELSRFQKQLEQKEEHIIEIKFDDETVVLNGDLAARVVTSGVTKYITEALEAYCDSKTLQK
jgi:hypothetical protein